MVRCGLSLACSGAELRLAAGSEKGPGKSLPGCYHQKAHLMLGICRDKLFVGYLLSSASKQAQLTFGYLFMLVADYNVCNSVIVQKLLPA